MCVEDASAVPSTSNENNQANDNQEKFTFFWGKTSPFSQMHPAEFTIDDVTYNCAEQYMMYHKAGK